MVIIIQFAKCLVLTDNYHGDKYIVYYNNRIGIKNMATKIYRDYFEELSAEDIGYFFENDLTNYPHPNFEETEEEWVRCIEGWMGDGSKPIYGDSFMLEQVILESNKVEEI